MFDLIKMTLLLLVLVFTTFAQDYARGQEKNSIDNGEGHVDGPENLEVVKSISLKKFAGGEYWLERDAKQCSFGTIKGPFVFRARKGPTYIWQVVEFKSKNGKSQRIPFFLVIDCQNAYDVKVEADLGDDNWAPAFTSGLKLKGNSFFVEFAHRYEWDIAKEGNLPLEAISLIDSNDKAVTFDPQKGTVFLFSEIDENDSSIKLQQIALASPPIEVLNSLLKIDYDLKESYKAIQAWIYRRTRQK